MQCHGAGMKKIKELMKKNKIIYRICVKMRSTFLYQLLVSDGNRKKFLINLWQVKQFDRRNKTDFSGRIFQDELMIDKKRANDYSASPKLLLKILREMQITNEDSIIDLGSGKGMAMYYMLKFPFKKVAGVELAESLCPIAENNLKILFPNDKRYTIYNMDAGSFLEFQDFNYIYIYNSFPRAVMEEVVKNICDNINQYPRNVILIYVFPEFPDVIELCGKFQFISNNPKLLRGGAWIYQNKRYVNEAR